MTEKNLNEKPVESAKAAESASSVFVPTLGNEIHLQLFKQLQRLNDDTLKGDDLRAEVERSHAVTNLSQTMINNATLVLKAHMSVSSALSGPTMPALITRQKHAQL